MGIKNNLEKLKERDVMSLLMFCLYKLVDIPEYSSLSELCYVLDKNNLYNLCEFFGGANNKNTHFRRVRISFIRSFTLSICKYRG